MEYTVTIFVRFLKKRGHKDDSKTLYLLTFFMNFGVPASFR